MIQITKEIFEVSDGNSMNNPAYVTCEIDYQNDNFTIVPFAGNCKVFTFQKIKEIDNKTNIVCDLIKEANEMAISKLLEAKGFGKES